MKITGIRFKRAGKVYYFDPGDLEMKLGQKAIVETVRGVEMGDVVIASKMIEDGSVTQPLKKIMRIATDEDMKHAEDNKAREPKAMEACHEKIRAHNLPMKLVGAEYTFDNSKIIFYFTAEGRVDFRELVKDLAAVFKMRIELRQIGVRDEAKLVGGLGPCGLPMCCTTWLGDFDPVSIKMAKEQNLSLNPAKISGICGRLMCCLKYESGMYDAPNQKRANGTVAVPLVPEACRAEAECIGCEELSIKEGVVLEDEEGVLAAESPVQPVKPMPKREWDRGGRPSSRPIRNPETRDSSAGQNAAGKPSEAARPEQEANGDRHQEAARQIGGGNQGWQGFKAREKVEPKAGADSASPSPQPQGRPEGARDGRRPFSKNRRRGHGERRSDGGTPPEGHPEGE